VGAVRPRAPRTAMPSQRRSDVTALLAVGDSKNKITLARSSADVSPPYGFMLLPGTAISTFDPGRAVLRCSLVVLVVAVLDPLPDIKREPRPEPSLAPSGEAKGAPASFLNGLAYTHLTAVGIRSRLSTGALSEQQTGVQPRKHIWRIPNPLS
jgi:hypothetical protein